MTTTLYNRYGFPLLDFNQNFDVRILTHTEEIYSQRLILGALSPFLRSILKGHELSDEPVTILLPDFHPVDVRQLLGVLYGRQDISYVDGNRLADIIRTLRLKPLGELLLLGVSGNGAYFEDDDPKMELSDLLNVECTEGEEEEEEEGDSDNNDEDYRVPKHAGYDEGFGHDRREVTGYPPDRSDCLYPDRKRRKGGKQGRRFVCKQCDYVAVSKTTLLHHREKYHDDTNYTCDHCEYSTGHRSYMRAHVARTHSKKTYTCDVCDYVTKNCQNLRSHKIYKHGNKRFVCAQCSQSFHARYELDNHTRQKHEGFKFLCDECHKTFESASGLKKHKETKHENAVMNYDQYEPKYLSI